MLFVEPGTSIPKRIHCSFVSDDEVQKITKQVRDSGTPNILKKLQSLLKYRKNQVKKAMMMNCINKQWNLLLNQEEHQFLRYKGSLNRLGNRAARLIETWKTMG